MSNIIEEVPVQVVMGAYWDGNKVLALRRAQRSNYPGFWTFPGGKVEYGETLLEALIREFREEADLHVLTIRASVHKTSYKRGELAYGQEVPQSCDVTCFTIKEVAGIARGAEEGTAAGWFVPKELLKLDLIPSVRSYLLPVAQW